jgi:hypothetical protein
MFLFYYYFITNIAHHSLACSGSMANRSEGKGTVLEALGSSLTLAFHKQAHFNYSTYNIFAKCNFKMSLK